ncbi:hypothetical protein B296_00020498 [Ensete ventricosum]|uniref:Uncharacterized protein n=1 Tax=Ensete ventricosum TaxID=4639 RepID=A0A426ZWG9_ENSVE|nr:hypothetical protein B296_00020498 [Ensete ventricosum]
MPLAWAQTMLAVALTVMAGAAASCSLAAGGLTAPASIVLQVTAPPQGALAATSHPCKGPGHGWPPLQKVWPWSTTPLHYVHYENVARIHLEGYEKKVKRPPL